jgi:hypothetical protein
MTKSVSRIFGNETRVKIMRLFIFNPDSTYNLDTVTKRTLERRSSVVKELRMLVKAGLLKRRTKGYSLDKTYPHLEPLEHFLVDASPVVPKEIAKKLSRTGSMKLLLISGIFIHDDERRVDLLVVGDKIRKAALTSAISNIESQLGKELRYSYFETADFNYRLRMYDKLIRDILDYPHQKILNKLGI